MKKIAKCIIASFSLCLLQSSFALQATESQTNVKTEISPVGYWKTIDDVTNKPKAVLQLWETPDHILFGKVLKVFPQPNQAQLEVCKACEGEKHNQPIVGLVILENLKQSNDENAVWDGGTILDPKNGKVYYSKIQLTENGSKLNVRGYVGTPLFGRTQTWVRVSDLSHA